jgi:hypothetical protein
VLKQLSQRLSDESTLSGVFGFVADNFTCQVRRM